jgi:hypothetical protein
MIMDKELRPSFQQSATTGTQLSTHTIDLSQAGRYVGRNGTVRFVATIDTTYSGGTSTDFQVIQSANADMSSPDILASSGAIPVANLTAGSKVLDTAFSASKRYLATRTVTVGTHTAGAHTSGIVRDTDMNIQFAAETGW